MIDRQAVQKELEDFMVGKQNLIATRQKIPNITPTMLTSILLRLKNKEFKIPDVITELERFEFMPGEK